MKKTICDICKKEEGKTLSLYVDSQMGPAGSTESLWETFDICLSCLTRKLNKSRDKEFNNKLYNYIKGE